MENKRVLIVGGGLAGISAAVRLTQKQYQVHLIEARPRLGGRASSILDTNSEELIDNCQHVSMKCCTEFENLCRITQTDSLLSLENELCFIARDGKRNRFRNHLLPAPAHLGPSFLRFSFLTFSEKLLLAKALGKLLFAKRPASGAFSDWLLKERQTETLIERFWKVILVSALSEDLDRIDFYHARKVFLDGFLRHRDAWKVQLLTVPLGAFYDQHLGQWLKKQGAKIETQSGLKQFHVESNDSASSRIITAELRNGETLSADHFVLAVSGDRAASLLPEKVKNSSKFRKLEEFEYASITSIHLWFEKPLTTLRHAVLVDRVGQWVFNRTALLNSDACEKPSSNGFYYQVVISNSKKTNELARSLDAPLITMKEPTEISESQQKLISCIVHELREIWPESKENPLLRGRVITEHRAVFSVLPGIEEIRPEQQTNIKNLQVAGDWTETGWPSTMESAVRSGFKAAENIIEQDAI